MGHLRKHHKFFLVKKFGRNFDTRRIFYEKLDFSLVGKRRKMILDVKKCDFSANTWCIRPIYWIRY